MVDPNNAPAISAAITVASATRTPGQAPAPSGLASQPTVTRSEESVAYSPGSNIVLPVDYSATNADITNVFVSVVGANDHFSAPLSNTGSSGVVTLPVTLPSNVQNGQFCVDVAFQDSNGLVGSPERVCITVSEQLACDTRKVSGGEGVTSTIHQMGGNSGTVLVDYETFTVKDKIDVFQNGMWVAGTGPITDRNSIRTALDCSQATEAQGYVGRNDEFLFSYDTSLGGDVEVVVVSGCENNGTAWNYTASCPGDFGQCTVDSDCTSGTVCQTGTCVGQGVLRFSLTWSAVADFDLHVTTPNGNEISFNNPMADGGTLDVDNTDGGQGAIENVFFDSSLSSGQYQFYARNFSGDSGSFRLEVYEQGILMRTEVGQMSNNAGEESQRINYQF